MINTGFLEMSQVTNSIVPNKNPIVTNDGIQLHYKQSTESSVGVPECQIVLDAGVTEVGCGHSCLTEKR